MLVIGQKKLNLLLQIRQQFYWYFKLLGHYIDRLIWKFFQKVVTEDQVEQ